MYIAVLCVYGTQSYLKEIKATAKRLGEGMKGRGGEGERGGIISVKKIKMKQNKRSRCSDRI